MGGKAPGAGILSCRLCFFRHKLPGEFWELTAMGAGAIEGGRKRRFCQARHLSRFGTDG